MNKKQIIASIILGCGILLMFAIVAIEVTSPGYYQPSIDVSYEDGMPPVDKVYTRADATYTQVEIPCPNMTVTVDVLTYDGELVTEELVSELTEITCGTLEKL